MASRIASRLLRRSSPTLGLLRSYTHVRNYSSQLSSLLPVGPQSSKLTRRNYYFPNASPYQLWSRSFASDNGDKFEAVVPFMGESVTDGTLANFLKKPGDRVEADEAIAQIETDKVTIDVSSPEGGVIEKFIASEGDTVTPGTIVAIVSKSAAPAETHVAPSEEASQKESPPAKAEEKSPKVEEKPTKVEPPKKQAPKPTPSRTSPTEPQLPPKERERRAIAQQRKSIFDQLLAKYNASLTSYRDLKLSFDAQAAELARYKAAAAYPSEVDVLKGRNIELERQLGEREAQRDATIKERDRLRQVETDLSASVKVLAAEKAQLNSAHLRELEALAQARQEMEEELQVKYEASLGKIKTAEEEHRRQLGAAEKKSRAALSEMHQLDHLIADSWPGTQEAADKVVQAHQQLQQQEGVEVDLQSAAWTPEEVVIATRARMPMLKGIVLRFREGVL